MLLFSNLMILQNLPAQTRKVPFAQDAIRLNREESKLLYKEPWTLQYLDFNPAPKEVKSVILFIHGYGGSSVETLSLGAFLKSQGVRLLAVDLPGCGFSQLPGYSLSMETYASYLHELVAWAAELARNDSADLFLAAHSTGCHMLFLADIDYETKILSSQDPALQKYLKAWQEVKGLICLAPNGLKNEEGLLVNARSPWMAPFAHRLFTPELYRTLILSQVYYNVEAVDPEILRLGQEAQFRPGAWQALMNYTFNALGKNPLDQQLQNVHKEVLILWGQQDQILDPSYAQRFSGELPHNRIIFLKDCGHGIHAEKPAETAEKILKFLKDQGASEP